MIGSNREKDATMDNVSVIIPTWNRSATLEKAIRSALAQTIPPQEVLVCDDGSTDGSKQKVSSIRDNRVRWIEGTRGGRPAIPRNRGIRESKGNWIAFLDSDDEWQPQKLEKQLELANRLGCKAVCSSAARYIPSEGIRGAYLTWTKDTITFNDLLRENLVICSSALIHKSLLLAAGGFPEDRQLKALEDYALWLRIATWTDFAYISTPEVIYRDDPENSIRSENDEYHRLFKIVFKDFLSWKKTQSLIKDNYSRAVRARYLLIVLRAALSRFFNNFTRNIF